LDTVSGFLELTPVVRSVPRSREGGEYPVPDAAAVYPVQYMDGVLTELSGWALTDHAGRPITWPPRRVLREGPASLVAPPPTNPREPDN